MPTRDGAHAYTDEEKAEIIAHVLVHVACGRPVDRIFREDDMTEQGISLPAQSTFWLWLFADETNELSEKLTRARDYGVEALIDRAIATAETTMMGEEITIEKADEDDETETVVKVKKADMLGHRKLYIETMFKAAQMLKPRKYGAKLDLTSDGKQLSLVEQINAGRQRLIEENDRLRREREEQNG